MSLDHEVLAKLRADEFLSLLAALLQHKYPGAKIEEREDPEDSALDFVVSPPRGGKTAVQAKLFRGPLPKGAVDRESLQVFIDAEGAERLLLALLVDMPDEFPNQLRDRVADCLSNVDVEVWGPAEILALVDKYPEVRRRFFELQPEQERRWFERALLDLTPPREVGHIPGWLRLAILIGIVVVLVWLPVNVNQAWALVVAAGGLLLLGLTYLSARVSATQVGDLLEIAAPLMVAISPLGAVRLEWPSRSELQLRLQRLNTTTVTLALMAFFFVALRALRFVGALAYGLSFFLAWPCCTSVCGASTVQRSWAKAPVQRLATFFTSQ